MQVLENMMMQCTWWHDKMQHASEWHVKWRCITGRHLAQRSRGVTTLHHYKRISSQDLGWHRGETEEEEVKQSCFFDKWVKPKNLARLNKLKKKEYSKDEQSWKHSVRKEEQGTLLEPCRLKDIRRRVPMDKKYMQVLRLKRDVQGAIRINYDNTPVKKR